jgi:hypothetical protein
VVPSPLRLARPQLLFCHLLCRFSLVVATVAAWVSSPDVNAPVMGAGSSAFNLLDFYDN